MTDKANGEPEKNVADTNAGDAGETGDDAQFADLNLSAESTPTEPAPSRLPLLLSVAALVLAGLAFAAGALRSFSSSGDAPADDGAVSEQIASLSAELRGRQAQLDELERQISRLASGSAPEPVDVDAIERRIDNRLQDRLRLMESVPARVASLESALTALRGISTGARDAWLLAEAEYYLQIGNSQLQLAGNPGLATLALKLADERIVELGDPGLTDVRRVLTAEIRSLETLETTDIEGATLELAGLSRIVDDLPLQQRIVLVGAETAKPDAELSGTDRALATLKNAMTDVVSVRRTDEAARPLLAPDAVYFLRANLSLQLQAARLAMLRGEQALFQQSLDDAASWLREYYDTESAPVRGALQTLSDIRQNAFARAMPDISGSLRLIREYIAFIETSRVESAGRAALPRSGQRDAGTTNSNNSPPVTQPAADPVASAPRATEVQASPPSGTLEASPQAGSEPAGSEDTAEQPTPDPVDASGADAAGEPAEAAVPDDSPAPAGAASQAPETAAENTSSDEDSAAGSDADTQTQSDDSDPEAEPPQ